jgi:hypothetical protein
MIGFGAHDSSMTSVFSVLKVLPHQHTAVYVEHVAGNV